MHTDQPEKNLPVQEQLDNIYRVLESIGDVNLEADLPIIKAIQNLQLRMCRIEQAHRDDLTPMENIKSDAKMIIEADIFVD